MPKSTDGRISFVLVLIGLMFFVVGFVALLKSFAAGEIPGPLPPQLSSVEAFGRVFGSWATLAGLGVACWRGGVWFQTIKGQVDHVAEQLSAFQIEAGRRLADVRKEFVNHNADSDKRFEAVYEKFAERHAECDERMKRVENTVKCAANNDKSS